MTDAAVLLYLVAGHALADYPLQGDWLSKAKNHTVDSVPGESIWFGALLCHSWIHALAVLLATGSLGLASAELVAHFVIDYAKCSGRIGYNTDQTLKIACKLAWFGLFLFMKAFP
jgi:hypothetical protein